MGQQAFRVFFGNFLGDGNFGDEHPLDLQEDFAFGEGESFLIL